MNHFDVIDEPVKAFQRQSQKGSAKENDCNLVKAKKINVITLEQGWANYGPLTTSYWPA